MGKIKAAIFDMDGVLTDTVKLHFKAWKKMFEDHGYKFEYEDYKWKVDGKPRLDGIRSIAYDVPEDKLIEMAEEKQKIFLEFVEQENLKAFEDSIWLLNHLKQNGIKLAVASSSKNTTKILTKIGIYNMFDTVVTGYDFKKGKPDPEIFLTAAERLNVNPKECAVFEDAIDGVKAGICAGMLTIGICRDGQFDRLKEAHYVVDRLDKISLELLENLHEKLFKKV
ncbi:HAD family hydrolase [Anaerocellum diazotrophicum]|uniref:Beta-phosphoglucomutase n=1 Tax=Caldicellulosiruptor diazotrophicus TaxID=2806205 RepID=A0ABM7NPJ2_9FIRM|nr:beta-phosphoglucomutase family hydrolase [Caldicellulosiruptor diazotrophicus]BCS82079.1 beta-phosphoglucomutase [Caldicellulosiruptor diazotrophicus]